MCTLESEQSFPWESGNNQIPGWRTQPLLLLPLIILHFLQKPCYARLLKLRERLALVGEWTSQERHKLNYRGIKRLCLLQIGIIRELGNRWFGGALRKSRTSERTTKKGKTDLCRGLGRVIIGKDKVDEEISRFFERIQTNFNNYINRDRVVAIANRNPSNGIIRAGRHLKPQFNSSSLYAIYIPIIDHHSSSFHGHFFLLNIF